MSNSLQTALTVLIYVVVGMLAVGLIGGLIGWRHVYRERRKHSAEIERRRQEIDANARDAERPAGRGRFKL